MEPALIAYTFDDLHKFFDQFPLAKYIWIYRGQSDASWKLKPKVGREEFDLGGMALGRFRAWRTKAVAHIQLPDNEWEQLAIAQHYGLATILLDWTENPLVATFFAVFENIETDGIVYVHAPGGILQEETIPSPFEFEKYYPEYEKMDGEEGAGLFLPSSLAYYPKAIDNRIITQQGVFTVHLKPHEELTSFEVFDPPLNNNLLSIRIKAEAKKDILERLKKYGIDYHSLFPGLDGLSKLINRETKQIRRGRTNRDKT